jgi:hypothetical protein
LKENEMNERKQKERNEGRNKIKTNKGEEES